MTVTKQQFQNFGPKRIKELQFGIPSCQDLVNQSVVEVADRHVYDLESSNGIDRNVTTFGPLDRRLGTSSANVVCETCLKPLKGCNGHFGYVKLALPTFHIGYLRKIIEVLHSICKVISFCSLGCTSSHFAVGLFSRAAG